MQVRISEDTYETIKAVIDEEIWALEQEVKDYAGYDCETDWRGRRIKELETVRLDFVEGARMSNKDNSVLDEVVAQVQKLLEATKHTLDDDPMLCYDDDAFSMEYGTKAAYEKVLRIIEKRRRCGK